MTQPNMDAVRQAFAENKAEESAARWAEAKRVKATLVAVATKLRDLL